MSEERALLAAVAEQPGDDAPRLVYADWLEEHGGAEAAVRAEFIRVQVERARLDELDPRRYDLAVRERALLERHGNGWRRDLPAWTRKEMCWFRRGFPSRLTSTINPFLQGAGALYRAAPLEGLALRRVTVPGLEALAGCPHLGRLRHLDLSSRCQEPSGAGVRYHDAFGPEGAHALARSPYLGRLESLNLNFQRIGDEGVQALAGSAGLGSLAELDLACVEIGPAAVQALAGSPHRHRLTLLALHAGNLGRAGVAALGAFSNLTGLLLHDTGFDREPDLCAVLEQIAGHRLPVLRTLTLSRVLPERFRQPALRGALPPPGLHALELHGCFLNAGDVRHLADWPGLGQLRLLNLRQNVIKDEGAEAIANSAHLAGLVVLNLQENAIRDAGARALAESPYLTNLRLLDLEINRISPGVLARLRERFGDAVRWSLPHSTTYSSTQVAECHFFTRREDLGAAVTGVKPG